VTQVFLMREVPLWQAFGPPQSPRYLQARTKFIQGLAGLTMLTYVLQVQVARGSNLIPKRS
jgi:phosphatidylinositol kinase/protein kinase (PI-3  family)